MKLAEKFGLPVVTFIDTMGAYPGIGSEERGVAEAIAVNLMEMSRLRTPLLSVVIGEGGSGGALGLGTGDRLIILEYAYYSVISPEGCAAILWRSGDEAPKAAEASKLTAKDLVALGIMDEIIPEPPGGAHNDPDAMAATLKKVICAEPGRTAGQFRWTGCSNCVTRNTAGSDISTRAASRSIPSSRPRRQPRRPQAEAQDQPRRSPCVRRSREKREACGERRIKSGQRNALSAIVLVLAFSSSSSNALNGRPRTTTRTTTRTSTSGRYPRIPSRNPSSLLARTGCWSLRMAFASIWRTRSRVTLKTRPTSSSV